jgi:uncharacterized membrane protein
MMEEFLIAAVEYLRLSVEAVGAAVIGVAAVSTVFRYALSLLGLRKYSNVDIRLYLGQFLALGLEFQLAADILATAVAPTFQEVQLLAAIVVIRTVLNYFLSKELEREREQVPPEPERDLLRG